MGKQGPCYHCGVSSTPLWRNGPPEKPVLCNACGSRWRTKGTLANYTPLHARNDSEDYEDLKGNNRSSSLPANKTAEEKLFKRKQNHDSGDVDGFSCEYNHFQRKFLEEDAGNRSSSGSAISNSESYAQVGSADYSDLTGPSQSVVWDSMVPSRKRTCFTRPKPSSVEKLTKDLHSILNEQQSYCFSGSSEEDLIFDSETPMVSVEIGHGSVLIRHPNSIGREEDSEASSLSVENKNECFSYTLTPQKKPEGDAKIKGHKQHNWDKCLNEIEKLLGDHFSPLLDVNLSEVVNYEEFGRQLTYQEQQQLLMYLPSIDVAKLPDSIKTLFDCPQFKECLSSYQQLLSEGVYDLSLAKNRDNDILKRLTLSELTKSKWVEHYNRIKNSTGGRNPVPPINIPKDKQTQNLPETGRFKSSWRRISGSKEQFDGECSSFGARNQFALTPEKSNPQNDLHFAEENSDQDVLLDVPCNNAFPQAELLNPVSSLVSKEDGRRLGYSHVVRPWP